MAQPAFTTEITIGGQKVVLSVPRGTRAWRKANAVFCPLGPAPSRAWFLMKRADVLALSGSGSSEATAAKTITWKTTGREGGPTKTMTFSPFYLVKAERLLPGGADDDNALYLVEFADARHLLDRASETGAIIQNIRSYANTADYLTGTSGATWTSLVTSLWAECPLLGAFPGLPFAPDAQPENTWLIGLNAWRALTAVLEQLDCAVKHDPTAGTYGIEQLGGAQTIADHNDTLVFNGEPISVNHAAETVRVYFRYHRKSYGQERDTELANNWAFNGAGDIEDVATGIAGAQGRKALWDDLPWLLDEDHSQTNAAATTARANARASRYATRMTVDDEHRVHFGLIDDLLPGGKIRATLWRNWDDRENPLGGTVTEFVAGTDLIAGMHSGEDGPAWFDSQIAAPEREGYSPPDYGRGSFPTYPRLPNIVQINHSGNSPGDNVEANGDGLHKGRVRRWVAGAMATMDDCWILFVDNFDSDEGDIDATQGEYYGPARLCGMETSDGESLPLYLVRNGGGESSTTLLTQFRLYDNMNTGGFALANILTFNGLTYTIGAQIRVFDWWSIAGSRGMWQAANTMVGWGVKRTIKRFPGGPDEYDIVLMEVFARMVNFIATDGPTGEPDGWGATNIHSWDGVDPGNEIEVFDDPVGTGGARFSDVVVDCAGTASRSEYNDPNNPAQPYYQIISSQRAALTATAKAKYDFGPLNKPTLLEDTWLINQFGDFVVDPGEPVVNDIRNSLELTGKANDLLYFVRQDMTPPFTWLLLVVQGQDRPEVYVGKTTSTHNKGVTQNVTRYNADTEVATGDTDSVKNLAATVQANKFCGYMRVDGVYIMTWAECP